MPLRSSTSSVLRWPAADAVLGAARRWARDISRAHPELLRLGVFGSYGRGDAGFGSDLDLIAIVAESADGFLERGRSWPIERLPVPTELLIYTQAEWQELERSGGRFVREVANDVLWLELGRPEPSARGRGNG